MLRLTSQSKKAARLTPILAVLQLLKPLLSKVVKLPPKLLVVVKATKATLVILAQLGHKVFKELKVQPGQLG
jgi:hypothetical protein